jgi:hypothetical protein
MAGQPIKTKVGPVGREVSTLQAMEACADGAIDANRLLKASVAALSTLPAASKATP